MSRTPSANRPYAVYTVEGNGDGAFWHRVGSAFQHEDKEGFNIVLHAFPVNGKLVIRKPKPQTQEARR